MEIVECLGRVVQVAADACGIVICLREQAVVAPALVIVNELLGNGSRLVLNVSLVFGLKLHKAVIHKVAPGHGGRIAGHSPKLCKGLTGIALC